MRSRVMPGSSPTMDRRSPISRLKSVDLPTFGRPTMATRFWEAFVLIRTVASLQVLMILCHPREFGVIICPALKSIGLKGCLYEKVLTVIDDHPGFKLFHHSPGTHQTSTHSSPQPAGQRRLGEFYLRGRSFFGLDAGNTERQNRND